MKVFEATGAIAHLPARGADCIGERAASVAKENLMKSLMSALSCIVLVAAADPAPACAQERYPSRPVQVIVPATAGGPVDTAVRIIEPGLSAALGEPVILQNRPGASGTVGMQSVATAEPSLDFSH